MRSLLPLVLAGGLAAAGSAGSGFLARGEQAVAPAALARADTVREHRGFYETGFEVSWFHPCDAQPGDDTWWVTFTDAALRQRDSLAKKLTSQPRSLFVRWRGTTSMKMPAGHMGRGTRYMLVSEVLELRPAEEAGCAAT
jgi:hypothetical protein